jgi:lipoprotein-releasing system ATP-binding protein
MSRLDEAALVAVENQPAQAGPGDSSGPSDRTLDRSVAAQQRPAPERPAPHSTALHPTAAATLRPVALEAAGLHKSYFKGKHEIPVLRGIDLKVYQGEFLSIIGQSGSGKSTLLHVLGTLDAPDCGTLCFQDHRIDNLSPSRRDVLRNRHIGMVFQFYHLLPELTTLQNVLLPLMIAEGTFRYFRHRAEHHRQAAELLTQFGLGHRLRHLPRELSGGEMQRAAIARALITHPDVLLADEPTGNLDQSTGHEIMQILRSLNAEADLTIVMVTHDQTLAADGDRIVRIAEGVVQPL